jgi:hypothetical protein
VLLQLLVENLVCAAFSRGGGLLATMVVVLVLTVDDSQDEDFCARVHQLLHNLQDLLV